MHESNTPGMFVVREWHYNMMLCSKSQFCTILPLWNNNNNSRFCLVHAKTVILCFWTIQNHLAGLIHNIDNVDTKSASVLDRFWRAKFDTFSFRLPCEFLFGIVPVPKKRFCFELLSNGNMFQLCQAKMRTNHVNILVKYLVDTYNLCPNYVLLVWRK